jgi:hypothetical protein
MQARPVSLALVLVDAHLIAVEVGLKDAVYFQHPAIGFADEGTQDGRDHLAVVEGAQGLAGVVQQTTDDVLLILPIAMRTGRCLQAVRQAIHRIGFVAFQGLEHVEQQVRQVREVLLVDTLKDLEVRSGAFVHALEVHFSDVVARHTWVLVSLVGNAWAGLSRKTPEQDSVSATHGCGRFAYPGQRRA